MNWAKANRDILTRSNYVLKANTNSGYWFGIWKKKLDEYRSQFGSSFNIILYGSEITESDFYVIPFYAMQDLLTEENLYSFKEGKRWIGSVRNHILKFRHSNIKRNIADYFSILKTNFNAPDLQRDSLNDYAIENAKREVQVRLKQSIFRKRVLENFSYKCCLTGITEKDLLVASHIIPWAAKLEGRLSPHNGLCLSALYDKLFDTGYFSLNNDLEVIITSRLQCLSERLQSWLRDISGVKIRVLKHAISVDSIAYHREYIFAKFQL